jgi:hypothetical protein
VALGEVVNPKMDDRDLDRVSSAGTPYSGVETVRIGRRMR